MTRKTLKMVVGLVSVLVIALTAGVVVASTKASKGELPEYLGSESCIGCHSDKWLQMETAEESHWNTENILEEIKSAADLPHDPTDAAPELKELIAKAKYYFHGRFVAPDLKTGELKYLPVEFDEATHKYKAAPNRNGTSLDANCGGCHAGRAYQDKTAQKEIGVGCETCHGPGREHILNKGDVSKIFTSTDPTISCAQCHTSRNTKAGATSYPVGYRPGMKLEQIPDFVPAKADKAKAPEAMHHKGAVEQWKASGHANATNLLIARGETYLNRQECINCHSTKAGMMIEDGQKFVAKDHLVNDGVSCVACHDPHGNNNSGSLKMEPQALCLSCHTLEMGGKAPAKQIGTIRAPHRPQGDMLLGQKAIGVPDTTGPHSGVTCIECHMTDNNHLMSVLKPADVMGTTRKDSCSACHAHSDSTPEARDAYLHLWEESINGKLATLKADITKIEAALKANPNVLGDKKVAFEEARANFWYVEKDKSGGAHNFEYAIKILAKVQKDLNVIKALPGVQ